MFLCRPDTTGCSLRAQRQAVAVAVLKGIHLLFDNIGHFTDGPLEELGFLDNRQAYLAVSIGAEHSAQNPLNILPAR